MSFQTANDGASNSEKNEENRKKNLKNGNKESKNNVYVKKEVTVKFHFMCTFINVLYAASRGNFQFAVEPMKCHFLTCRHMHTSPD